LKAQRSGK